MSEDKKEPWLNYLALTTVILAVCATLATFKGGGFSTKSIMNQSLASDEWAHYQAKSVKQNLYELSLANVELERKALSPSVAPAVAEAYEARVKDYEKKVGKYDQEKNEIQEHAKDLEKKRDDAQKHGYFFGIAVIFLQISILLSSIAALLKKKPIWMLGVGVGLVGVVYFANGFLLLF